MLHPNNDGLSPPDTIHALSSGHPPAGIAVIRISGPLSGRLLEQITGRPRPDARRAVLRTLRDADGEILDRAMVIWLPGPQTATGEDMTEFHVHGSRAVVQIVLETLRSHGSRMAEPGEFTRRALMNGRMDLSAVEGLADLLAAETEMQRRDAMRRAEGAIGRILDKWTDALLRIAAAAETAIDHDDGDMIEDLPDLDRHIDHLSDEMARLLSAPPVSRLRDGIRVAIVGPPNAGKSTLFNALVGYDAAIVSPIAGTTRDVIERPVSIAGIPFLLLDSAGIRDAVDPVERIGVERAVAARDTADIVIDLSAELTDGRIMVAAKADLTPDIPHHALPVSAHHRQGLAELIDAIVERAKALLPHEGEVALDQRYRDGLSAIAIELRAARQVADLLLKAEHIRVAREQMDRLTGRAGIEDLFDTLFDRFCLGK